MVNTPAEQATHSPLAMRQIVFPAQRAGRRSSMLPLGRRLIEAGLIREDQLQTALAHQASEERRLRTIAAREGTDSVGRVKRTRFKRLGEVVAELGLVDEAKLLPIMGEQLGVEGVKLSESLIDPVAVRLIPRRIAERLRILPIICVRDCLTVAMADPQDLAAIDTLAAISGCRIRPVLTLAEGIARLLPRCYEDDFSGNAGERDAHQSPGRGTVIDLDDVQINSAGRGTNGLLHYALSQAIRQNASVIHFEPGTQVSSIRFRVDGRLREAIKPKRDTHENLVSRLKRLAGIPKEKTPVAQAGRFTARIGRREVQMQLTTMPTGLGDRAAIRVLDRDAMIRPLDDLGFTRQVLNRVTETLRRRSGLVLVSGPKDNGLTTTLYSIAESLKGDDRSIATLEEQVSFPIDQVCQMEWSIGGGLNSPPDGTAVTVEQACRQDQDVLLIDRIANGTEAAAAVEAALSGRLVVASLHAEDGIGALARLIQWQIPRGELCSALVGTISQRLLRKVCPSCSEIHHPELETLQSIGVTSASLSYARGRGCAECSETGYRGRVGVFELTEFDQSLRGLLESGVELETIRQHRTTPSLLSAAMGLAENKLTSLEEIIQCVASSYQPQKD
ncbi:MAG: ATPase, T2SS/T4P/T4SS family [Planctomycetota bacterium]